VLKNRFTGRTGYAGTASYNETTGRLKNNKARADEFEIEEEL
jgi:hypothetical protein